MLPTGKVFPFVANYAISFLLIQPRGVVDNAKASMGASDDVPISRLAVGHYVIRGDWRVIHALINYAVIVPIRGSASE
jgi:hypothetical protein